MKICLGIFCSFFLLNACKSDIDYTKLDSDKIYKGVLKDAKVFYLFNLSHNNEGFTAECFIYNNNNNVDKYSFKANSAGHFSMDRNIHGKISLQNDNIVIKLPNSDNPQIIEQTVELRPELNLNYTESGQRRYIDNIFDSINTLSGIIYARNKGFYTSKPVEHINNDDYINLFRSVIEEYKKSVLNSILEEQELDIDMDIYEPSNDSIKKRPLIIYVHGGAFVLGDKQNRIQQFLVDYFVKKGYVLSSINYRLGCSFMGLDALERSIYRGTQDVLHAVNYIVDNSDKYRIDTSQIYLCGNSAGGIISLNAAYMCNHEIFKSVSANLIRSDLGSLPSNTNIKGIISLWGAISDLSIISKNDLTPCLLIHGNKDEIIPIDKGLPFKSMLGGFYEFLTKYVTMYGSLSIYNHMKSLSLYGKFITLENFGHEPHIDQYQNLIPENVNSICENIKDFIDDQACEIGIIGDTIIYDNPTIYQPINTVSTKWNVKGGFIIKTIGQSVDVVWFKNNRKSLILYSFDQAGRTCESILYVK